MIIKEVEICNFRSFRGRTVVKFAPKGVNVLCGENGGGKTNFLNAIYWCITGKTTPRCTKPGQLSYRQNGRIVKSAKVTVRLDVSEPNSGHSLEYVIERIVKENSEGFNENQCPASQVTIHVIQDGGHQDIITTESRILEILQRYWPEKLAQWFFFDSEAIGELNLDESFDQDKKKFMANVRSALGLDTYFLLQDDLNAVSKMIKKDVNEALQRETETNSQIKKLSEARERFEKVEEDYKNRLEVLEQKNSELEKQIASLTEQLSQIPSSEDAIRLRNKCLALKRENEKRLETCKSEYALGLGRLALCLPSDMYSDFLAHLIKEKKAQNIPSKVGKALLDDILSRKQCICGRPFADHSPEHQHLLGLLKRATTNELTDRVDIIQNSLGEMPEKMRSCWEQIQQTPDCVNELEEQIVRAEKEILTIDASLENNREDEIRNIQLKLRQLRHEKDSNSANRGAFQAQVRGAIDRLSKIDPQLESLQQAMGINEGLRKTQQYVDTLIRHLDARVTRLENSLIRQLSNEMNRMIGAYLIKHRKVEMDPETYAVHYVRDGQNSDPNSTGEEQILKFAFLSAMMSLSTKHRSSFDQHMICSRPLFVDAPFSTLDSHYREAVAYELANNCEQLILMTASDGWTAKIQEKIAPCIGKQFLITYEESGDQGDKLIKHIEVNGQSYALNSYGAEYSQSKILDITQ